MKISNPPKSLIKLCDRSLQFCYHPPESLYRKTIELDLNSLWALLIKPPRHSQQNTRTYSDSQAGNGKDYPKKGDTVTMHYVGTLSNGNKFDSSRDRGTTLLSPSLVPYSFLTLWPGKPFETKIGVGQVIKGWDEGVPKMSLGEKAKLTITPYAHPHVNLRIQLQHG